MVESKLIKLVRVMRKVERTAFRRFLESPYFRLGPTRDEQIALFDLLMTYAPKFNHPELTKSKVYPSVYPGQPFISGKLEKLMSALYRSLEQFILVERHLQGKGAKEADLEMAGFYRERGLESLFKQKLKKFQASLAKNKAKNEAHFYGQYLLEKEVAAYEGEHNRRAGDLNLPALLRSLDWFYLHTKLAYSIILLSQRIHINLNLEDSFRILEQLEGQMKEVHPIIQVYYKAFQLLRNYETTSEDRLLDLQDALETYRDEIPMDQQNLIRSLLRIQAIGQYNRGKEAYLQVAFDLYRQHLEQGFLYQEKKLIPSTFRNIVTLGLRVGALDWVATFLEDHQGRIRGASHPEEVYAFNMANLYFHRGDYDQALDQLGMKYEDRYYQLAARRLEVMIYYEMRSPILESKIEAFKVYIFRTGKKDLPEKPKTGNNNFIDLLRQILHPKTLKNETRLQKIREKLSSKEVVAEREWLLKKVAELA